MRTNSIALSIYNKEGKLKRSKLLPMNSWVLPGFQLLVGYGHHQAGQLINYLGDPTDPLVLYAFRMSLFTMDVGHLGRGIIVGAGDKPLAFEDYSLDKMITHGDQPPGPETTEETVYFGSSITGGVSSPNNALGAPDGVFTTDTGNTDWTHEWEFESMGGDFDLIGTQSVSMVFRKDSSGGGNPTVTGAYVRKNGSTIGANRIASTDITSPASQIITFDFNENISSAGLALQITTSGTGGPPADRRAVQLDGVTLTANRATGGMTGGQLYYHAPVNLFTDLNGNSVGFRRDVRNDTGGNMTVAESGVFISSSNFIGINSCLAVRDVFPEAEILAPSETLRVTYNFHVNSSEFNRNEVALMAHASRVNTNISNPYRNILGGLFSEINVNLDISGSDHTYGLVVGSGDSVQPTYLLTNSDGICRLEAPVPLTYAVGEAPPLPGLGQENYSIEGGFAISEPFSRIAFNETEDPITIKEIAVYRRARATQAISEANTCMVHRKILQEPVTVSPNWGVMLYFRNVAPLP